MNAMLLPIMDVGPKNSSIDTGKFVMHYYFCVFNFCRGNFWDNKQSLYMRLFDFGERLTNSHQKSVLLKH